MKILFIYSLEEVQSASKPLRSWSSMHFGISYISSVLKNSGHQVQLLVLGSNNRWGTNESLLASAVSNCNPRIICFTTVASQYSFISKIADAVKRRWPDKYLVLGGVHATLNPGEVLRGPFHAVCIGEGEYPLLELCTQLESNQTPRRIDNLWIKDDDGTVDKTFPRQFNDHIDDLPFPDRAMWHPWMKNQLNDELVVLLGRGCPYNCTYCCNHALKVVASGKYVRMRSAENIIQELALLHRTYPYQKRVYFEVESIALDKKWLSNFCRKLTVFNTEINNSFLYGCNYRLSSSAVDEILFSELKAANFNRLNIGLESGNERIRREVLKRHYSNDEFIRIISLARKYGFKVSIYNMIGLPGETFDDYLDTVSLNRICQPDLHYTGIFYPYPGTDLYSTCINEGLIHGPLASPVERRKAMIDLPRFTRSQIQRAYILFDYRVYRNHRPLWWILIRTLRVIIYSQPVLNMIFRKIVQLPIVRRVRARLAK